jgi:murein DD-endopeptidase MepM/ murein hydrolase activator NlpD
MARSCRATSLLLIALGVAVPVLPASAAAANAGGAAPGGEVASPAPTSGDAVGGAAPGVEPAGTARSSAVGGALPGHKPRRPRVVRRRTPKPKAPARGPVATRPPPPTPPVTTVPGTFPVQGPFSFGGDDARFGARRPGHIHQGQDVVASSGTPLVAPVAGTVIWKANQPGGAGIYVIVRGAGSGEVRDYVFMHLLRGSVLVAPGDAVGADQQLAQVGATGDASGPHLHFEIWIGGWYARGGAPIDPLPQLQRWAGLS